MKILCSALLFLSAVVQSGLYGAPLNMMQAKEQIVQYYESGDFEAECAKSIDNALAYLGKHEESFDEHKTVVFDIDDTILLYFEHIKKNFFCLECLQCGYNAYYAWLEKADAVEVAQVKRLYDYCVAHKYHIIFLSGRAERYRQKTIKNLALRGYTIFDVMILKTEKERIFKPAVFKANRRAALVKNGFNIVASVGDQPTDFVGGNVGYAVRLPNYLY